MRKYTEKFRLDAGGDVLEVEWDGNVWVAPSCGAQYAHQSDALRCELAIYLRGCGEELEDTDSLSLADYGEWLAD